jgi:addiction module RelE/StbE family toxin
MRIRWLAGALHDLRGIHDYIAVENPQAARRVVGDIRREIAILETQPEVGRPGRLPDSREFIIQKFPYIVAYRIRSNEVHILLVVHASRRWPKQLP